MHVFEVGRLDLAVVVSQEDEVRVGDGACPAAGVGVGEERTDVEDQIGAVDGVGDAGEGDFGRLALAHKLPG